MVAAMTMAVTTVLSMSVSVTRSMAMPVVTVVPVMTVMSERAESDESRQWRDVIVTVMRVGGRTGQRHHNQPGGSHDSQFIYPLPNHFSLQFALMTQPP
jgi:hypothetical protein